MFFQVIYSKTMCSPIKDAKTCNMFYTIMQYTNIALVCRMLLVKSTQSLSHRVSLSEAIIQQV